MVVVSILPYADFGPNDYRENASHKSITMIKLIRTYQSGLEQYLAYSNESEVTLENLEELASLKSVSVSYWDDS